MNNSCFEQFAPIAAIATHPSAAQVLTPLAQDGSIRLHLPRSIEPQNGSQHYEGSLREYLSSIWTQHQAFVFCLAAGAVVRLIAPLLRNKAEDPAVIVIDAQGNYVVSLCSGHQGKADLLAQAIASTIDATPVITGAAHGLALPAMDIMGFTYGWRKGSGDWTGALAAIAKCGRIPVAKQESVQVIQEAGSTLWQEHLPEQHPFTFGFNELENQTKPQARIWISPTKRKISPKSDFPKVQWHPRVLWIGVGCERNTSKE
ncbi:MAG: cobalamin biosynthesis central domain-containing protein, partial [Cyanobacteria bacterium J06631_2]